MNSDPVNIGKFVDYAGDIWKIVGINYLGDYDLERFESRSDGRTKIGTSCELELPDDHPHYAVLVGPEWMAAQICKLRRALLKK